MFEVGHFCARQPLCSITNPGIVAHFIVHLLIPCFCCCRCACCQVRSRLWALHSAEGARMVAVAAYQTGVFVRGCRDAHGPNGWVQDAWTQGSPAQLVALRGLPVHGGLGSLARWLVTQTGSLAGLFVCLLRGCALKGASSADPVVTDGILRSAGDWTLSSWHCACGHQHGSCSLWCGCRCT
jgi:hypothetical protein